MARIPKAKLELLKSALLQRSEKLKEIWKMLSDVERLVTMIPDVDNVEYAKLRQKLVDAVKEDSELMEIIRQQGE